MRAHGRSGPCAENAGTHCTRGTGKAGRRQAKRGEGGRLLAIGAASSIARAAARVEARLPFGLGKNDPGRARSTTQAMFPYLLLRARPAIQSTSFTRVVTGAGQGAHTHTFTRGVTGS